MLTYKNFSPSALDPTGNNPTEFDSWQVLEVSRSRDSGPIERSNFEIALIRLGGESASVQVHRYHHWACGWFELIVIDPADKVAIAMAELSESNLAEYPVLDDTHAAKLEHEVASEVWGYLDLEDRVRLVQDYNAQYPRPEVSVFAARCESVPADLVAILAE